MARATAAGPDETAFQYRWRVEGMDCASCALKIERAVSRFEGVSEVEVSVTGQSLRARAPERSITPIEGAVQALGYTIGGRSAQGEHAGAADAARPDANGHEHGGHGPDEPAAHGHDEPASDGAAHAHEPGQDGHAHGADDTHGHVHVDLAAAGWWRQRRVVLTAVAGLLIAAVAILEQLVPTVGPLPWLLPLAVGLVPVARRAFTAARLGSPFSIEMLMTIAAVGAVVLGAMAEAASVVFLFAVGELLEGVAAGQARRGIRALSSLMPRTARLERDGTVVEVAADTLAPGQLVQVRPGDRVPADGTIVSGTAAVDEAPVTGESMPQQRTIGDTVYAGTVVQDALLRVEVTRVAADNTIARIIRLVEEAQEAKAPVARFIDSFAKWYTPAIALAAVLVAVLPPLLAGAAWSTWIYRALALLLIACPCALVISTPAAIASALSTAARRGLLIKGGAALERLAQVRLVAFDKTGTLTEGKPRVTEVLALDGDEARLLVLAAAVEAGSSHPLAQAILEAARERNLAWPAAEAQAAIAGRAVVAKVDGIEVSIGSPRHAAEAGALPGSVADRIEALEADGRTVVVVQAGAELLGLLAVRDEPREEAMVAIARLDTMGVKSVMLTGDNPRTAAAIARGLGIDHHAGLLPEDKARLVRELGRERSVAKVGDGINDAPALAAASVGIAMGGGTDVALETAEVALVGDRVDGVAALIALARRTMRNVRQNVGIALGLKALFLVTTLLGITGLWPAILADTGATVLVTLNALRLLRAPA